MEEKAIHCQHFVMRKKRFCRMTVKSGYDFCGEHQPKVELEQTDEINQQNDPRLRIPCPLDSKHTCYASKLAKHLKKCNAKKETKLPYIVYQVNVESNKNGEDTDRKLSNVHARQILEVISKVNQLYADFIESKVRTQILHHDILTDELNKSEYGTTTRKHLIQTSSLIEHLNRSNLIKPKTCFVEFGAGKGQLSFWVSKVIKSELDTSVLLVERASLRHKLDNKLDKNENNVFRIRADIADLVLNEVECVKKSEKIVGLTKHLCGEATDLALRCLKNCIDNGTCVSGLIMAFCCHHRCHWSNYVGKQFFNNNNLTKTDFDIICGLVSWATCGSGKSREYRNNEENREQNLKNSENFNDNSVENNEEKLRVTDICLTREEKETIGYKCKLLIDYGRSLFLENNNFNCQLFYYVDQKVTLENVCIVAVQM